MSRRAPGSLQGLHLVVDDVEAARDYWISRGVQVSDVFHDSGGVFHHADGGQVAGLDPQRRSYASFATFTDPTATSGSCRRSPNACRDANSFHAPIDQ